MIPMQPAKRQHGTTTNHSQIGNCEPQEPEATDPEEAADPEESLAQDPWLKEPDKEESPGPDPRITGWLKEPDEADESPEFEEAEESFAVMVVVVMGGAVGANVGANVTPGANVVVVVVVVAFAAKPKAGKRAMATTIRIIVLWSYDGVQD